MIIQFKDREREMAELRAVLDEDEANLFIIYGRRRVGKTELALNATKNRKRVYYLATGENNLERFYNACLKNNQSVSKLKKDWEVLFGFLKDNVDVVIIDEFQNMIQEDRNILNIFQSVVDTVLNGSKLKLFLLGSSVSVMTSKVMSYKSPLYGRRSGSMNLKPVRFAEMKYFFPDLGMEELMEIYGFADGIPFYMNRIDGDFFGWLEKEISHSTSFLRDEVDFLVRYEFSDVGTYKLILEAIANGHTKINEIKDFIMLKRTDITPYLKNLIEVGFVSRRVPVTENVKSRRGRYFISDNFIRFWFRFIYPNLSSIEEGVFNAEGIGDDYNSYLGHVFEDVCREFIAAEMPISFNRIGSWWHKEEEIDIVSMDDRKKDILFVECKWKDGVDAVRLLARLREKAKGVEWKNSGRNEHYCIIAKSFSRRAEGCMLFDLKDLERRFVRHADGKSRNPKKTESRCR